MNCRMKWIIIILCLGMLIGVGCTKDSEPLVEIQDSKDYAEVMDGERHKMDDLNKLLDQEKREADYTKDYFQHVPESAGNEDVFKRILNSYEEGSIDEKTFYFNNLMAVINPKILGDQYGSTIYENHIVDMSYEAQWLYSNFDELDDSQQKMVTELFYLEVQPEEKKTSWNPFITTVYAAENDMEVRQISEGIFIVSEETATLDYFEPILQQATFASALMFPPLSGETLNHQVYVYLQPMLLSSESYSFYGPMFTIEGGTEPQSRIFLNTHLSDKIIVGAYLHELFHAIQNQMGYDRLNWDDQFIMESTAVWAVAEMNKALEYHKRYDKYWLDKPTSLTVDMDENVMKSWYQLFYYASEINDDTMVVKSLLSDYLDLKSVNKSLDLAFDGIENVHNLFDDISLSYGVTESPWYSVEEKEGSFAVEPNHVYSENEMIAMYNGKWQNVSVIGFGFKPIVIEITDSAATHLEIITDVYTEYENRTGMSVLVYEDGEWFTELTHLENKVAVTIDLTKRNIENIFLCIYSYDFDNLRDHGMSLTFNTELKGNGVITCNVHKEYLEIEGQEKTTEDFYYTVDETVKLYKPTISDDTLDYHQLILGDVFYIEAMDITFFGSSNTSMPRGEEIKKSYDGDYQYRNGDLPEGSFDNNIFSMLPGFSGDLDGLPPYGDVEKESFDIENLFPEGMNIEGVLDLLPEEVASDIQKDLEDIDNSLDELNDMNLEFGQLFPPSNQLKRFKIDENSHIFHIYRLFPNELFTNSWVTENTETKFLNSEGEMVTTISEDQVTFGSSMPIWFFNADYNQEEAESKMSELPSSPDEFFNAYSSLSEITEQIGHLNGSLDASNLMNMLNEPAQKIDMELIHKGWNGYQIQELEYDSNTLNGTINAQYVDENGTLWEVDMTFTYEFE